MASHVSSIMNWEKPIQSHFQWFAHGPNILLIVCFVDCSLKMPFTWVYKGCTCYGSTSFGHCFLCLPVSWFMSCTCCELPLSECWGLLRRPSSNSDIALQLWLLTTEVPLNEPSSHFFTIQPPKTRPYDPIRCCELQICPQQSESHNGHSVLVGS